MKIANKQIIPYEVCFWLPFEVRQRFLGTSGLIVPTLNGFGVFIKDTNTRFRSPIRRTIDNYTPIPWFKCRTLCK